MRITSPGPPLVTVPPDSGSATKESPTAASDTLAPALPSGATGRTGNPRYYAGGDCVNGGREVVDAVADGKRAALAMLEQAEAAHV